MLKLGPVILLSAALVGSAFILTRKVVPARTPAQHEAGQARAPAPPSEAPGLPIEVGFEDRGSHRYLIRVHEVEGRSKRVTGALTLFDDVGQTAVGEAHSSISALAAGGSVELGTLQLPARLADGFYRANTVVGWKDEEGGIGTIDRDLYLRVEAGRATVIPLEQWMKESNAIFARKKG
jgi:hypothetical protein